MAGRLLDGGDDLGQERPLLPIRIIKRLLPCLDTPWTIYCPDPTPEMIATLERERDRMTTRIDCLVRNRDAIASYLATAMSGG